MLGAKDLLKDEMPSGAYLSNSSNLLSMFKYFFVHGCVLLFASIFFIYMHSLKLVLFLHYNFQGSLNHACLVAIFFS